MLYIVIIDDEIVQGFMPKRALKLVFEWMELHKSELIINWNLAKIGDLPNKIQPLKY